MVRVLSVGPDSPGLVLLVFPDGPGLIHPWEVSQTPNTISQTRLIGATTPNKGNTVDGIN